MSESIKPTHQSSNLDGTQDKSGLAVRVDELRVALMLVSPEKLAERTGSRWQAEGPGRGVFQLAFFNAPLILTYPDLISINQNEDEWPPPVQALVVYYFYTGDGSLQTGNWVSFADLPDGRMYNQAFQGYSGDELVKTFGLDVEAFRSACRRTGGVAAGYGDASFVFTALPRVSLMVNYWCGDEDFPSTCKILFDASASHYLPTDVCAILGGMLVRRILKAK